jgi:hypothetical protein
VIIAGIIAILVGVGAVMYYVYGSLQQTEAAICPMPYGSAALNAEVQGLNQEGINATLVTVGNTVYLDLPNDTLPVGWAC